MCNPVCSFTFVINAVEIQEVRELNNPLFLKKRIMQSDGDFWLPCEFNLSLYVFVSEM